MTNLKGKIENFLLSSNVLIENSISHTRIKTLLEGCGFPEARLLQGRALLKEVEALHNAQKKEFGEQIAATAEVDDCWTTADKAYMKTLKIARVALKDILKADKATMLYGARKESLPGWIVQAKAFYTNLLGDSNSLNIMSGYGYAQQRLLDESAMVDQVEARYYQQKTEIGEAQAATQARDKKLDELAAFVSDLRAIAKVALDDDPQLLEILGITVRSPGYASKKQQPPEGA